MSRRERREDKKEAREGAARARAAAAGTSWGDPGSLPKCAQGHIMSPVSSLGYKCYSCEPEHPPMAPADLIGKVPADEPKKRWGRRG